MQGHLALAGHTDADVKMGIEYAMECGDLLVVRYLMDRDGALRAHDLVEKPLAPWLARAIAHEGEHGEGSFLDAEHRFNKDYLPFLVRIARGEHLTASEHPVPEWDRAVEPV